MVNNIPVLVGEITDYLRMGITGSLEDRFSLAGKRLIHL